MFHNSDDARWYVRTPRSLFGGWVFASGFIGEWCKASIAINDSSTNIVPDAILQLTGDWPFADRELNLVIDEFIAAADGPFRLQFQNGRVLTAACAHELVFILNDEVLNEIWQRCGLWATAEASERLLPGTAVDINGHWNINREVSPEQLQHAHDELRTLLNEHLPAVTAVFREAYLINEANRDLIRVHLRRELAKAVDRRRVTGLTLPSDTASDDALAVRDQFSSDRVQPRLSVTLTPPEAILDGVKYEIEPDDATLLIACIEAQGSPVSAQILDIRTNRVRRSLAERNANAIADLIESASGKGTYIARQKLAELGLLLPGRTWQSSAKI